MGRTGMKKMRDQLIDILPTSTESLSLFTHTDRIAKISRFIIGITHRSRSLLSIMHGTPFGKENIKKP